MSEREPLLVVGDLHLSVTPPGRRDEHYLEDAFAKLEQITDLARDHHVGAVLFVGDIFHQKRANRVPYALVTRLMHWLGRLDLPVYILPGNHDLADGTIESLTRQPLAALSFLENVTIAGSQSYIDTVAGWSVLGVPGVSVITDARVELDELLGHLGPATADLVLMHAPLADREFPWPTYQATDVLAALPPETSVKWVLYGHQHDRARVVAGNERTTIAATGAVMRGSISEANEQPAVLLLDWWEGLTIHQLKVRPAADVYRWAELGAERTEDAATTAFVDAIGASRLEGFSREGLIDTIRKRADLTDPVKAMAADILEA